MEKETIFVTGIDTDAGKSYATGWLANHIAATGRTVMTQKLVQTGNVGRSEDIEIHRRLMGMDIAQEDYTLTAPVIFTYPASPHLAARLDGREVDFDAMDRAREVLESRYDTLLIEGAGGMMVPLTEDVLTIDFALSRGFEIALVTNGRLGSINHTILSLEALRTRGLKLRYMLYNAHFDSADRTIADDARLYIARVTERFYPAAEFLVVPTLK